MHLPLESTPSGWREPPRHEGERASEGQPRMECGFREPWQGAGVGSIWVGVLEELWLRLVLQAGSCPMGTHI